MGRRRKDEDRPAAHLGRRIREQRERLGLSQLELAARAKMTSAKLSELENGRSGDRGPTLSRLYQVAEALGVPPAALLDP